MAASQGLISENALRVLQARYLRRDGEGKIVDPPNQLFEQKRRKSVSALASAIQVLAGYSWTAIYLLHNCVQACT